MMHSVTSVFLWTRDVNAEGKHVMCISILRTDSWPICEHLSQPHQTTTDRFRPTQSNYQWKCVSECKVPCQCVQEWVSEWMCMCSKGRACQGCVHACMCACMHSVCACACVCDCTWCMHEYMCAWARMHNEVMSVEGAYGQRMCLCSVHVHGRKWTFLKGARLGCPSECMHVQRKGQCSKCACVHSYPYTWSLMSWWSAVHKL